MRRAYILKIICCLALVAAACTAMSACRWLQRVCVCSFCVPVFFGLWLTQTATCLGSKAATDVSCTGVLLLYIVSHKKRIASSRTLISGLESACLHSRGDSWCAYMVVCEGLTCLQQCNGLESFGVCLVLLWQTTNVKHCLIVCLKPSGTCQV